MPAPRMIWQATWRASLLLAASLLAACGGDVLSKATVENYERIESGMSKTDVHDILGSPDEIAGDDIGNLLSLRKETWRGPKQRITVTYTNDAVVLKSIDAPEVVATTQ